MRERAQELKAEARKADGEKALLAKIAEMPEPDRAMAERLLELDEVERRLKPFGRRYLGVREIPLDALVGTDGRAGAFTRDFRPLHAFSRDRMRALQSAFADGAFPPIVTVKLGETYFVIDGHHRVALARRAGADAIDADVTELVARVPLPAGADMLEVLLRELERIGSDGEDAISERGNHAMRA